MANHLIIGLGGTGGKILREMRKRIYEEFRSNNPTGKIKIEYLYIDSSPADLDDKSEWKTMGGSVHLLPAQKISINGIGASVLDNLHQYPGIEGFVTSDDKALMKDIGGLISAGIGGQRRRLGRLLFANNVATKNQHNFIERLSNAVQRLNDGGDQECVFHVCAGLAGGTGSGAIVDTVAQIRKKYGPRHGVGDNFKLLLYLYIPEMILVDSSHDSGYYKANGYAALAELNALSVGSYLPVDVTGMRDENGDVKRLLSRTNAFEVAYLFSNVNEAGKQLKIGSDLPAAVADFLYQKIVSAEMSSNGKMERLSTCENDGGDPECDMAGNPIHSRKFMTFGIKRVEYPETEIEEFVAYSFARQAARQMKFNLWRDGIGFDECSIDEIGMGFAADVKNKANIEALLLSNNYLTLAKPLVENANNKNWKGIASGWENVTQFFADDAQVDKDKTRWLAALSQLCEDYFNRDFRGEGVKNFYRTQRKEKKAYAAFIRRHIEEKLFNDWLGGQKSILEVVKYISELISNSEHRIDEFKNMVASLESDINDNINPSLVIINNEWNNIGWLRDAITNASSKVFSSYKSAKCDFYTASTEIEGYRYAMELLLTVIDELASLLKSSEELGILLTEVATIVEEQVDSKCKIETGNQADNKIVKKYDPEQVREVTKRFTADSEIQSNNSRQVRSDMKALLGEDGKRSFGALLERLDLTTACDIFVNTCLTNATTAMNNIATSDAKQKMLQVNILEKIKQEYNTDERLEEFINSIIRSSQCYLQFNAEEMSKILSGKDTATTMMKMIQLSLPEYNDSSNFRDKFISMFTRCCPGFKPSDVSVNYKPNQIVIIAAASGFPIRYIANAANLKEAYEEKLIGSSSALNRMVMHTESINEAFPPLFDKSIAEKKKELIPIVLLAFAMGIVVDKTNPTTGVTMKAVGFEDEFGDIGNWVMLGKNVILSVESLAKNDLNASKIKELVQSTLSSGYIHNDDKANLKKSLGAVLRNDILPACKGNDLDPIYVEYKKNALNIVKTLEEK